MKEIVRDEVKDGQREVTTREPELLEALRMAHRALRAFTPADGSNMASLFRAEALDAIDKLLGKDR